MKKIILLSCVMLLATSLFGVADLSKYAKVTEVNGKVMLSSGNSVNLALKEGDFVLIDDKISTAKGASVSVKIEGFGVFTIKENTAVVIKDMVNRSGKMEMKLSQGSLLFGIKKLFKIDAPVKVETPTAVAAVRGTAFTISSKEEGTHIAVLAGEVAVKNDEGEQSISELQEANIGKDGFVEVVQIKETSFDTVKELLGVKDIGTIKDVGDLEGNLERLSLMLEDKGESDSTVDEASVEVESAALDESNSETETEELESIEESNESAVAEREEKKTESEQLITDDDDL